jgi:hypothetical protein
MAMVDQSLLQSGFDAEILLGPRYLKYLLLTSLETGTLSPRVPVDDAGVDITIRPPEDYERLYEPHPDAEPLPPAVSSGAFETEILFDHPLEADLRVRTIDDVQVRDTGEQLAERVVDLFAKLTLETSDEDGIPSEPGLRIEVVALELDPLLASALADAGKTPEDVLPDVKRAFDRTIGLGVAGEDQRLQRIEMQKVRASGDHPDALGVYLNLRLRSGPEEDAFLEDRGDLANARNFLPPGEDFAFGMPGSLYPKLGADAKFRMAEETSPGSGEFQFPIREDASDPDSEVKGKIKDISVSALEGDALRIEVHGEYFVDFLPDPDFHFKFDVKPTIEDGLLTLPPAEHDLDVDLLGEFLIAIAITGLVFGLGNAGFMALVIHGVGELIVEPAALEKVSSQADEALEDASFLDALPHRVTAERRHWDALYATKHEVVSLLEAIQINDAGIAFSGKAALDKEPDPIDNAVIRTEQRDGDGAISELWYRIREIVDFAPDFTPVFPATDRRDFERVVGDDEFNLVRLTLSQIRDRIAESRVREQIGYVPQDIFVEGNQIRLMRCISDTEIGEQRRRLLEDFRERTRAEILAEQGDALREQIREELEEENGGPPTDEEVEEELENRLDDLVAIAEETFVEEELPQLLDEAIRPLLRFDLDAPEFAALEDDDILVILGYQRIRRSVEGGFSDYYRDRRDKDTSDNLRSLPRYVPLEVE